jgi:hypothetical protein
MLEKFKEKTNQQEYINAGISKKKTLLHNLRVCVGELRLPKEIKNFKGCEFKFNDINLDDFKAKTLKRPNVVICHLRPPKMAEGYTPEEHQVYFKAIDL